MKKAEYQKLKKQEEAIVARREYNLSLQNKGPVDPSHIAITKQGTHFTNHVCKKYKFKEKDLVSSYSSDNNIKHKF